MPGRVDGERGGKDESERGQRKGRGLAVLPAICSSVSWSACGEIRITHSPGLRLILLCGTAIYQYTNFWECMVFYNNFLVLSILQQI